jgi:UDP-N-acetylglucosamine acyltransferase
MIHSTAIIHPKAKLDASVTVGPYAVIDEDVELGEGCAVGPHVYITGRTVVGARNRFHAGCVIGDAPQDWKYKGDATCLRIGEDNVFREHVTVHRSNKMEEDTIIGSNNFLMHHSHVAHNCAIGNHVILAGGALLAGHVTLHDRAFISGNCLIHQYTRVGTLAMMQGGAMISQDLPPFAMAHHGNEMCGLNITGLRRAGFNAEERLELKQLYRTLFRSGMNLPAAIALATSDGQFKRRPSQLMLEFVATSKRGVCADVTSVRRSGGMGGESEMAIGQREDEKYQKTPGAATKFGRTSKNGERGGIVDGSHGIRGEVGVGRS